MTREEAIIRLKEGEPFSEIYDPVWDEALKMAISALEKNESAEEWYKLFCEEWDEGELVCHVPNKEKENENMGIKLDETIKRYESNAEFERTHGNLQGCLEFRQLVKWLRELKMYRCYKFEVDKESEDKK